jgi:hypothetical protein
MAGLLHQESLKVLSSFCQRPLRTFGRWNQEGAETLPATAVAENGDWDNYHKYRREQRHIRLYGYQVSTLNCSKSRLLTTTWQFLNRFPQQNRLLPKTKSSSLRSLALNSDETHPIDTFDRTIFTMIPMPAYDFVFICIGFFLYAVVKNQNAVDD